jgi:cold shock CspA family protein
MQFNNAEHPNAALYKALEVRIQVALTATREVGAITFWDKTKNFGTITRSCLCPVRAFLARNDPRAFEVGTIVDFQVAEGRTGGYVAIKIQAIQGESE